MVVECVDERHIRRAAWLFPAYLLLINVFVLPIAIGGLLIFGPGQANPETFVLSLPLGQGAPALALFAYIGGLSALTGMLIVETVAVSTMVCNDLVMPTLLRLGRFGARAGGDLTRLLLNIRRAAIVAVLMLGYLYFRVAGEAYALVSIGLISFAAVAQFAPALLGGIYWRGGTGAGALGGLARRLRRLGLHADAALGGEVRLDRRRTSSSTARSGSRCSRPSGCSALPASTTSPTRCSGACRSTSRSTSASRSPAAPRPARRARRCSSSTSSAAAAPSRCSGAAAPGSTTCARSPAASSAPPAPARSSTSTPARSASPSPTSSPTPASSTGWSARSPAPSAPPRRGSWSNRSPRRSRSRSTTCSRSSTRPRSSAATPARSRRSRARSSRRPASSAPPTSSCRASTT